MDKNNELIETIRKQLLAVRNSGLTNMFDIRAVKEIAGQRHFNELVDYIKKNRKGYANAIFDGKIEL